MPERVPGCDSTLPGWPKKKLVRSTRQWLAMYGISVRKPTLQALWDETWMWANQIAHSYSTRAIWPTPSEIAAQYVLLLMLHMHQEHALRLPHRAAQQMPERIQAKLAQGVPVIALPQPSKPTQPRLPLKEPRGLFDTSEPH